MEVSFDYELGQSVTITEGPEPEAAVIRGAMVDDSGVFYLVAVKDRSYWTRSRFVKERVGS